jgi:DNA repair protein RecN (Recombination protein N)
MRLRGLGVIDDAVLEFGPGLTVVTGETGAGKTMVVTGLGLLMGERADPAAVRAGHPEALVEGRIVVAEGTPAAERARQAGALLDDDEVLLVTRSIPAQGRGRAHLGGRGVPVGVLAELSEGLVTVHGQSEQLRLRSPARQREALDAFGGSELAELLAGYRVTWGELRAVEARLADLTERARERASEAELLRLGLGEVERVAPQPAEDEALRAEAGRLAYAEDLCSAASEAHLVLAGDPAAAGEAAEDVASLLGRARRALEAMRPHDPALAELADRASELGYLADDLALECAAYAGAVESDPARLADVEDRRAALGRLTRGHGTDVDGVLAWAVHAEVRLMELDSDTDAVGDLGRQADDLRGRLAGQARRLSRARQRAAERLATAVTAELQELSMPGSRLAVRVSQRMDPEGLPVGPDAGSPDAGSPDAGSLDAGGPDSTGLEGGDDGRRRTVHAGPDGIDDVELLLVPHAGAAPRPLAKGASGGELSRVMLGLEVVLGAADPVPTFVFDEVDAGVGGRAALGIGRRLARLACGSQVLVVTHLAQVAAFADRHLVVAKSAHGEVTRSGVHRLDDAGRVRELARMLGGVEDSGSAQAHAEELLRMAEGDRGTPAHVARSRA